MIIKVPTGGGKTLLSIELIRANQDLFAQKRRQQKHTAKP
jgi:CRISPR/Cas system-associated endonuclease/helicase Cas3